MSEDKKPDEKKPDEKKEALKTQKTTENTDKKPSVPSETFSDLSVQKKSSESKKTKEKSKKVKVSGNLAKIIEEIEKLSVLELNELVKALEEKFGVSATPMAAAGVATSSAPSEAGAAAISQQTTFNVILASSGANKISVIKAVREVKQDMGLKDAKDFVEAAPKELLTGVNKETAEEAKKKLEAAGATVELK
jgi:large subunit ribosomal protein L7/L12